MKALEIGTRVRYIDRGHADDSNEWGTIIDINPIGYDGFPEFYVSWDRTTEDDDYYSALRLITHAKRMGSYSRKFVYARQESCRRHDIGYCFDVHKLTPKQRRRINHKANRRNLKGLI